MQPTAQQPWASAHIQSQQAAQTIMAALSSSSEILCRTIHLARSREPEPAAVSKTELKRELMPVKEECTRGVKRAYTE